MQLEDLAAFYQHVACQVRHEIATYMGFLEPQASVLPGMCGEAAARTIEHLQRAGHPSRPAFLHLKGIDGAFMTHFVVIAEGLLIDPTITQFTLSAGTAFILSGLPAEGFVYTQPDLQQMLPGYQPASGPSYPIGQITSAQWKEIQPVANYTSRAYIVFSYPTRFARRPEELRTVTPFLKACETGDVEWRRVCAAGLEEFHESRDVQVITMAKALAADSDELVRQIAAPHLTKILQHC